MKKLLKQVSFLSICICLLLTSISTASAASPENLPVRSSSQKINVSRFDSACMNVYGNNTIENNRNVCIYTDDGTTAQRWEIYNVGGQAHYIKSALDTRYALNVDRRSGQNWNCTVYQILGNETDASVTINICLTQGEYYGTAEFFLTNYPDMILKADVSETGFSNLNNIHWVSRSASTDEELNPFRYHWDI